LARYFFDTSAIVKYYHAEIGTAAVSAAFAESGRSVFISSVGVVEIQSAFAMKVRSGQLTREQARAHRARFLLDIAAGDIEVYGTTREHFRDAERLIARHAFAERLRTLDAIQVAVRLDLFLQDAVDQFVVADLSLAKVAVLEGMRILNPEAQAISQG
jgi:predicted nucleic acid-binding protein